MLNSSLFIIKLPHALLDGIRICLISIIEDGSYSDKAVQNMLKTHPKWGSRDRKTATEIVYGTTRNLIQYRQRAQSIHSIFSDITTLDGVLLIAIYENKRLNNLVDFSTELAHCIENSKIDLSQYVNHSYSKWLYQQILSDWKSQALHLIQSLDIPAEVFIRCNTLQTTFSKLTQKLQQLTIAFEPIQEVKNALRIKSRNQLRQTTLFQSGYFEFQDISSQYVIERVGIYAGQTIIDYCAGKGGKTLQIASLMNQKGQLIASDIDSSRLDILKKRATRAGLKNLQIIEQKELLAKYNKQADMVIIDAPCSGTGTIRRQPDIKFRFSEKDLSHILSTQKNILQQAALLVKPNGKLLYITCSILKKENDEQIQFFLQNNPSFILEKDAYILPSQLNGDGFYFALLTQNLTE